MKTSMAEKNKNPEVRFKGFTEDWEGKKLGDISSIIGGGTPSTMNPEYWGGEIDWYSPTEIGKEIYANGSAKKITILGYENCSAKKLPPNRTILFTSRAGIGDMAILKKEGTTNQGFQSLILNEDISPYFIFSAGFLIKKYSLKNASGSTFLEISSKTLEKMILKIPKPTEQKKIGTFFQNLDSLLTQHQKKYDKLVILKKAMLDKMFPKNGGVVPEIRFKGFTSDWVEKPFGEFALVKRGLTYSPSNVSDKGVKVLRSSNIYEDTFIEKEDDVYVKDEAINIEFVKNKDILITSANGSSRLVGKHAIIEGLNGKAVHGGFMLIVRSKKPYFLNASMSSSWYRKFINVNVSGGNGAIGNLKASDFEEHKILVPNKEDEQQKIGDYFKNLDNQIALHETQLDKLKNIKKACLSKMFVAQD